MIFAAARLRLKLGWDFGLNSGTKHAARGNRRPATLVVCGYGLYFSGFSIDIGSSAPPSARYNPYHLPATTQLHLLPAIAKPLFPI